ncbi:hypothetical protein MBORA_11260 [Methanobrevibacter oralis]|uniref:Bacterial Ig-like domain protein n=1 Tax=Methanobrevibacter oralis TaxID=66851 RepID=A0A166AVA8_METOA|nr:hypothetical protein MBORA_11260 [Methanobrevibacter oralis]
MHTVFVKLVDDVNYVDATSDTLTVNVAKAMLNISAIANNITYGQDLFIAYEFNVSDVSGSLVFCIDNQQTIIGILGFAIAVTDLKAGNHTVFVKLVDDVNYVDATSATLTVNVAKATLNISAIANNITYGQDLVVSHVLNVGDAVGSVVYFVDGEMVGNSSVGSSINVSGLKAGLHTVFVKLVDDVNYVDATSATLTVNVAKVTLNISAIVSDVVYGQDLVVSHVLNVGDAVGSVVYFVDGEMVGNSSVGSSINVSGLKAGLHTVFVKLVDDVNYVDATSDTLTVNVAKVTLNISAIANNITYGQDLVVSHVLNVGDAVGSVVYFVDGEMVGNSSVGSSINVSALKAGLHTVFVKLVDDVNYVDATSDTLTVNVVKASNANITISIIPLNPIYGDKVNVNITVPTDADGKVLIVLDNKTTIIKAPGESYTFVPSNAGEHTISVSLVNDTNYMNTTNDVKFNVAKKNTLLIAPSLIKYYLSNDKLIVILKDSTGKILANKKVTIKINTVTYNLKTDSKGVAKLLIRLNPKSYVADIKFTGDNNYNVANKKVSVKVVIPKIKAVKNKVKRNKYLQVSFKTYDNKAIKNTKVTLKIKGKTYTAKTNNKGIAKLKLKVKKGTYKVKTAFKSPAKYGKTTRTLKIKVI